MKKSWSLSHPRIVWTIAAAPLAIAAVPALFALVLKALALAHMTALATWLLDVGHSVSGPGAAGGVGAGAAGGVGGPGGEPGVFGGNLGGTIYRALQNYLSQGELGGDQGGGQ